jgi:hypothetical protein
MISRKMIGGLEHFQKCCSHLGEWRKEAVFFGFGLVSTQSQVFLNLLLRRSLAKIQKILAPNGYNIFSNTLAMFFLVAQLCGCRKSLTTAEAASLGNVPAPPPATLRETVLRIHWMGKRNISADTNAAKLLKIWNLPESVRLEAQTLDKLSLAPWRLLGGETNQSSTNLLRPLLDDLANEESYVEVRRATNSSKAADEMVLAIHLDRQRAVLWQTNLAAALESLTAIRPVNSQRSGNNSAAGWSFKKHHAPNLIELVRKGDWTIVGASQDHNVLLDEVLAELEHGDGRFLARTENSWLELSGNLSRVASAVGIAPDICSNLPQVSFAVLSDPRYILTHGEITLAGNQSVQLDTWNIPTNLIDGDLTSFTAVRGLSSWLAASEVWTNLQIGPPPDQLYVWALHAFPMETYFAAPLSDASNAVSRITDLVLEKGAPWFASHSLVVFERSKRFNGLSWRGAPYLEPFLQSVETNGGTFVFGGCFKPQPRFDPSPAALLDEVLSRTNLIYYDWESTGQRIEQWIYLGQFMRLASGKAQLPFNSAVLAWLKVVVPQLEDCNTEIIQIAPGRLSFTRNSTVGLSAIELHLLADWLESPEFPCGMFTLLAPPAPGQ